MQVDTISSTVVVPMHEAIEIVTEILTRDKSKAVIVSRIIRGTGMGRRLTTSASAKSKGSDGDDTFLERLQKSARGRGRRRKTILMDTPAVETTIQKGKRKANEEAEKMDKAVSKGRSRGMISALVIKTCLAMKRSVRIAKMQPFLVFNDIPKYENGLSMHVVQTERRSVKTYLRRDVKSGIGSVLSPRRYLPLSVFLEKRSRRAIRNVLRAASGGGNGRMY